MPKDVRLRAELPAPNAPRLTRPLPERIVKRLERRREKGNPVKWTDRSLNAVVKYVSAKPKPHPTLPDINWEAVRAAESAAARDRAYFADRRQRDQAAAQRQKADTAVASSSRTKLAERLSAVEPSHTPIAPKHFGIDIPKFTQEQLQGIFRPKLVATLKRLSAIESVDLLDTIDSSHAAAFRRLRLQVLNFYRRVQDGPKLDHRAYKRAEAGLASIGDISFTGLRRNFPRVIHDLVVVERSGYFELS